jgi:hypothetical protein
MLDEAARWDDLVTGIRPATRGTKGKSASRLVSVGAARLAKASSEGWRLRLRPNSGCAWWAERLRERVGWADLWFFFYSEFLIHFLFIFSFEFKSNHTTNANLNISNMCINQKQSLLRINMMQHFMSSLGFNILKKYYISQTNNQNSIKKVGKRNL